MLASITPLGERGRHQRFGVTLGAYLLASTAAGALLGVLLGLLGAATAPRGTAGLIVFAVAAVLAATADLTRRRLPTWHRQVDENWLSAYRGWVYGAGYGAQLGLGVVTVITSATVHLLLVAEWLAAGPALGAGIGAVFGLVRGLPLLAARRSDSPAALRALHRRIEADARRVHLGAAGSAGLAALAAGASALWFGLGA